MVDRSGICVNKRSKCGHQLRKRLVGKKDLMARVKASD